MSDFDKVKLMFDWLEVPYKVEHTSNNGVLITIKANTPEGVEPDKRKVVGYIEFYSYYSFDSKGKFENIGIYE